jgi:hypothetical protein
MNQASSRGAGLWREGYRFTQTEQFLELVAYSVLLQLLELLEVLIFTASHKYGLVAL